MSALLEAPPREASALTLARPHRPDGGCSLTSLLIIAVASFIISATATVAAAGYVPYKTGSATGNVYYSSPSYWKWTDWSITDTSAGSVTVCHNSSAQGTACASEQITGNPGYTAQGSQRCKQVSNQTRSIYCEALTVPS